VIEELEEGRMERRRSWNSPITYFRLMTFFFIRKVPPNKRSRPEISGLLFFCIVLFVIFDLLCCFMRKMMMIIVVVARS